MIRDATVAEEHSKNKRKDAARLEASGTKKAGRGTPDSGMRHRIFLLKFLLASQK